MQESDKDREHTHRRTTAEAKQDPPATCTTTTISQSNIVDSAPASAGSDVAGNEDDATVGSHRQDGDPDERPFGQVQHHHHHPSGGWPLTLRSGEVVNAKNTVQSHSKVAATPALRTVSDKVPRDPPATNSVVFAEALIVAVSGPDDQELGEARPSPPSSVLTATTTASAHPDHHLTDSNVPPDSYSNGTKSCKHVVPILLALLLLALVAGISIAGVCGTGGCSRSSPATAAPPPTANSNSQKTRTRPAPFKPVVEPPSALGDPEPLPVAVPTRRPFTPAPPPSAKSNSPKATLTPNKTPSPVSLNSTFLAPLPLDVPTSSPSTTRTRLAPFKPVVEPPSALVGPEPLPVAVPMRRPFTPAPPTANSNSPKATLTPIKTPSPVSGTSLAPLPLTVPTFSPSTTRTRPAPLKPVVEPPSALGDPEPLPVAVPTRRPFTPAPPPTAKLNSPKATRTPNKTHSPVSLNSTSLAPLPMTVPTFSPSTTPTRLAPFKPVVEPPSVGGDPEPLPVAVPTRRPSTPGWPPVPVSSMSRQPTAINVSFAPPVNVAPIPELESGYLYSASYVGQFQFLRDSPCYNPTPSILMYCTGDIRRTGLSDSRIECLPLQLGDDDYIENIDGLRCQINCTGDDECGEIFLNKDGCYGDGPFGQIFFQCSGNSTNEVDAFFGVARNDEDAGCAATPDFDAYNDIPELCPGDSHSDTLLYQGSRNLRLIRLGVACPSETDGQIYVFDDYYFECSGGSFVPFAPFPPSDELVCQTGKMCGHDECVFASTGVLVKADAERFQYRCLATAEPFTPAPTPRFQPVVTPVLTSVLFQATWGLQYDSVVSAALDKPVTDCTDQTTVTITIQCPHSTVVLVNATKPLSTTCVANGDSVLACTDTDVSLISDYGSSVTYVS
jgi:hypothetical protein